MKYRASDATHTVLALSVVGGLVWASFAPFSLFLGIYLVSQGFSYTLIGLLLTTASILSSLFQLLFGSLADKYGRRRFIIFLTLLARSFACLMLTLSRDWVSISSWYIVSGIFLSGFMPIAQSMIADVSQSNRLGASMGKYRLSGSLGWAFSCIATGLLVGGNIWSIFPITLSLSSLSLLASLAIPEVEEERKACNKSTEYRMRVSLKIIVPFILSIFLSSIGMSAASSFLNILLFQLGSDPFFIGTTIAIGALLEVPAMYWGGRFSDKIGDIPVLILGEAGLGMVYWLYGTVKNFYTYLIIQGIRGILYALFTVSGMSLSSSIGRGGRGGLYAGLYNLSLQFGMSSGPFFGGLASDTFGITAMFLMASAFSELSAVLLVPLVVRGREGREYCRR